ncbi:MAG: photoactive yellow protein [Kangiellaceae bacterium]|nr:photoactive yellow protein [Kangiellaceae bacterium]
MNINVIQFASDDIENKLASLSDNEIDKLAFGAIELDTSGHILKYNQTEGAITGRSPSEVLGKNFFTAVAPCTNTPTFKGAFDKVVKTGNSTMFEYTFDYKMSPTKVKVHLKKALVNDNIWVFVKRL